jgi:hypothetical protein
MKNNGLVQDQGEVLDERRAVVLEWRQDGCIRLEDGSALAESRSARGESLSPLEEDLSAFEADRSVLREDVPRAAIGPVALRRDRLGLS